MKATWTKSGFIQTLLGAALLLKALQWQKFELHHYRGTRRVLGVCIWCWVCDDGQPQSCLPAGGHAPSHKGLTLARHVAAGKFPSLPVSLLFLQEVSGW